MFSSTRGSTGLLVMSVLALSVISLNHIYSNRNNGSVQMTEDVIRDISQRVVQMSQQGRLVEPGDQQAPTRNLEAASADRPLPREQRRYNQIVTQYDPYLKAWLDRVVSEKKAEDDPDVVGLVRELLEPPSPHITKTTRPVVETAQSRQIMRILNRKKKGFYVEVGGLDGERGSNSLWLERDMGWGGLLIEMDPYFYTMMKGHSRHAWTINCCLSPYTYPIVMKFAESVGGGGQLVDENGGAKDNKATSKVVSEVPCFPFHSIMLALNQTHVDYFSLDVEGFELDILRTIPYDKVDISTFSVEYVHGREGGSAYLQYMADKGYRMEKELHEHNHQMAINLDDYIFVKNTV